MKDGMSAKESPHRNRLNIHIYRSSIVHESRIFKETKAIVDESIADSIVIIGLGNYPLPEWEKIDEKRTIWRVPLPFQIRKKKNITFNIPVVLNLFIWMIKIVWYVLYSRAFMVNCHSVTTLPMGFLSKLFTGCYLIYDTHELETEVEYLVEHHNLQRAARIIERIIFPFVDYTITVSDSINNWYKKKYRTSSVITVKNIPEKTPFSGKKSNILRNTYGITDDELIYLYLGGLYPERGIENLISVFSDIDKNRHIIFMGYGPLAEFIKVASIDHPNIHYHKAVSPDKVLDYASSADVGMLTPPNICLNTYYSLPNKLFEYLLSGIPCIVINYPDMQSIIELSKGGWVFGGINQNLQDLILSISNNEVRLKKGNLSKISQLLTWEAEKKVLIEMYRRIIS